MGSQSQLLVLKPQKSASELLLKCRATCQIADDACYQQSDRLLYIYSQFIAKLIL